MNFQERLSLHHLSIRLCLLLISLHFSVGCAPTKGPGSTRHATSFGEERLSELRSAKVLSTNDGRWVGERLELANARSRYEVSGRRVEAIVEYDFRKHRTSECLTKEEAANAIAIPVDSEWTHRIERFEYKDGDWNLKVDLANDSPLPKP